MSDFYVSAEDRREPSNLGERADRILAMMANPSTLGGMPSPEEEYEAHIRRLQQADPPARGLGDEMVMLAAGPIARSLPFAIRMGSRGVAWVRTLSAEAEQAASAIIQSHRNRLGRDPLVHELVQALGLVPDVGVNRAQGLGNPFRGRTPKQVNEMFRTKVYDERWSSPDVPDESSYVNQDTNRSYHIDPVPRPTRRGKIELPHVDVNRLRSYPGHLDKKRYPLGERLYDR